LIHQINGRQYPAAVETLNSKLCSLMQGVRADLAGMDPFILESAVLARAQIVETHKTRQEVFVNDSTPTGSEFIGAQKLIRLEPASALPANPAQTPPASAQNN
jgi:hypothetical protein